MDSSLKTTRVEESDKKYTWTPNIYHIFREYFVSKFNLAAKIKVYHFFGYRVLD